jgi:dTDP-4-amino-4,6-dideoxygalactose transaminase
VAILPSGFAAAGRDDASLLRGTPALPGRGLHFSRGRYALGEAYRRAGLDDRGALLAPAYPCVTMLDPALALGAEILLYPLSAALAPDPVALDAMVERSSRPIKALLATHFFGFVRDYSWLKQWCDARAIAFVEDCSHTLFTERYQARGAGRYGQFVASSPYKFFPSADGGWLYAPDGGALAGAATRPAGWLAELRGMKQCFDATRRPRVGAADIVALDGQLTAFAGQPPVPGDDAFRSRPAQSSQYRPASAELAALRGSRWLIGHSSLSASIARRQANYRRWLQAVAGLPNCRPLYPELPEQVVPYMFPLYIDRPMPHFYGLKRLGVPVWRWDEMAVSTCPVAHDYRLHLLHLPCHQSLSDDEMSWMTAALSKVLRLPAGGAAR